MAHGYLHDEYDRDFSGDDRDRGWRDRGDRDWRGQDRDWQSRGGWEDRDRGWQDRDRGRNEFMFGDRDDHRGFFDRMGDRARETFRGDEDRVEGLVFVPVVEVAEDGERVARRVLSLVRLVPQWSSPPLSVGTGKMPL